MLHLFLTILTSHLLVFHPIHLGLTDIQYAEKEKSIQVIHKFFVDDLEAHIEEREKAQGRAVRLFLHTPKEATQADQAIEGYLADHFQLKVNNKVAQGKFLGKEYENDAVWIYIEYAGIPRPKQLDVRNDALIGLHEDHNNIINIEVNGKKGSLRFRQGYVHDQITF